MPPDPASQDPEPAAARRRTTPSGAMTTATETPDVETSAGAEADDSHDALWAEIAASEKGEAPPAREVKPAEETTDEDKSDDGGGEDTGKTADDGTGTDEAATPEARIKALEEQNQRLEHALQSEKGRTRAKTREVETLRARIAMNREALTRAQAQAQAEKAKQPKLDAVAKEYPEVAAPLLAELKELKANRAQEVRERQAQVKADEAALNDHILAEQEVFLDEHPDGTAAIRDNKAVFKEWIKDQPERVRNAYEVNRKQITDGRAAAMLVSRFKLALAEADKSKAPATDKDKNKLDAKRQQQLNGAQSTKSGAAPRVTATPGENASHEDLWNYWKSKGV